MGGRKGERERGREGEGRKGGGRKGEREGEEWKGEKGEGGRERGKREVQGVTLTHNLTTDQQPQAIDATPFEFSCAFLKSHLVRGEGGREG